MVISRKRKGVSEIDTMIATGTKDGNLPIILIVLPAILLLILPQAIQQLRKIFRDFIEELHNMSWII